MVGPILDQLTEEYSGKIKVCKINVDEENELAGRHGIVSIPTLVIYNNGEIVRQQVGALPKVQIESLFSSFL
jgi:thioredoxin 1